METTYEEHKRAVPAWTAPAAPEALQAKVNELFIPDGPKP
jgi:hypothetical protein